jgi:hypothetical protein
MGRLRSNRLVCRSILSWLHWLRSWLFNRYFLNSRRFRWLGFRHRLFCGRDFNGCFDGLLFRSRRFDRGLFRSLLGECSRLFDWYWLV